MLAQTMNPSREGLWTRLAPIAAMFAVVTSFVLALGVLVSTVDNLRSTHARTKQEQQQRPAAQRALVRSQPLAAPVGG